MSGRRERERVREGGEGARSRWIDKQQDGCSRRCRLLHRPTRQSVSQSVGENGGAAAAAAAGPGMLGGCDDISISIIRAVRERRGDGRRCKARMRAGDWRK